jgi:hypothetical protein
LVKTRLFVKARFVPNEYLADIGLNLLSIEIGIVCLLENKMMSFSKYFEKISYHIGSYLKGSL